MAEKTEVEETAEEKGAPVEKRATSVEKPKEVSGDKGKSSALSGILKKLTLFLIVGALMGTLVVAGWAAVSLGDLSGD